MQRINYRTTNQIVNYLYARVSVTIDILDHLGISDLEISGLRDDASFYHQNDRLNDLSTMFSRNLRRINRAPHIPISIGYDFRFLRRLI
ncbi:hypothetical protein HYU23_02880 [Candidatus Woesearchaeota archaeon]|nr:hypothetical protein [Candidatus Woesearchaeota archaeon]